MSDIKIFQMSEGDIDQVSEIGWNTPEFDPGTGNASFYYKNTLKNWLNDPNGITLVAKDEDEVVGFVLATNLPGPRDGYIHELVVLPEHRSQGLGSKLVKMVEERVKELGGNHIFGLVQEGNLGMLEFIKKSGFEVGGKFYYIDKVLEEDD